MKKSLISLLEITRDCNLNCKHCYIYNNDYIINGINELNINKLKILIQELVDAGTTQLILTGGEPFLYKKLGELFDFLKSLEGLTLAINTNGFLLLQEEIRSIVIKNKDLIAQLSLSVESGIPEIHENLRGKRQFNKVIKVIETCKQEQIPLLINSIIGPFNINSIESIFSLMSRFEIKTINIGLYIPMISNVNGFEKLTREQVKSICNYLLEQKESGWDIATCSMPYLKFFSPGMEGACCSLFKELLTVNYKGDLQVCMNDYSKIGSVLERNIDQLMKTEKVSEFLFPKKLKSKIKGKCASCKKFIECLGCRFIAFSTTRDYYASDPCCPYHFS